MNLKRRIKELIIKLQKKNWKKKILPVSVSILGVLIIAIGLSKVFQRVEEIKPLPNNSDTSDFLEIVTEDTDTPDESKPDVHTYIYEVPDDIPRRIIIEDIAINNFIQKVGITEKKSIAVPSNIHIAGWLINSAKPGEKGLSIIDGHVGGVYSGGIFIELIDLKPQMTFEIEFGDYSRKQFEVISVQQISEAHSSALLFKKDSDIDSQLNLITCGGDFNRDTGSFEDRIIVVSKALAE